MSEKRPNTFKQLLQDTKNKLMTKRNICTEKLDLLNKQTIIMKQQTIIKVKSCRV